VFLKILLSRLKVSFTVLLGVLRNERFSRHYGSDKRPFAENEKTAFAALFLSLEAREIALAEENHAALDICFWKGFPNMCYTVREPLFG